MLDSITGLRFAPNCQTPWKVEEKKARAKEDERTLEKLCNMTQKLSAKEEGIINCCKSDLGHIRKGRCLSMNDISWFMGFLKQWNDTVCKENISMLLLFYEFEFIKFNKNHEPQCHEPSRGINAKRNDIFQMKYNFIPIKFGNHYTLVVIYLVPCKIHYHDSLNLSPTRSNASYKRKLRQSILEKL